MGCKACIRDILEGGLAAATQLKWVKYYILDLEDENKEFYLADQLDWNV